LRISKVVEQYVQEHYETVMEQDRRIRERNAERTTPPAFEEIRKKGHAKVLAMKEQFARAQGQEKKGDPSPR